MSASTPPSLGSLAWRVAKNCDAGSCVKVARSSELVLIGDTKNPDGPVLSYTRAEWTAFAEGIRQGDFDDLFQ